MIVFVSDVAAFWAAENIDEKKPLVADGATNVPPGVLISSKAGVNGGTMALDNLLGPAPLLLFLEWPRIGGDAARAGGVISSTVVIASFFPPGVGVVWSSARGPVGVGGVITVVGPSK